MTQHAGPAEGPVEEPAEGSGYGSGHGSGDGSGNDPAGDPADEPVDDVNPRWTVAAVAARLGVAPATLRSWSRRYGVGPVDHRAGRYRRYTDTDVAELETMRRLAADGMVLSSAAALARHHRPDTPARHRHTPEIAGGEPLRRAEVDPTEVRTLVHAARRLDTDTLVRTLEASLQGRDVSTTWHQLCRPGLAALDPDSTTSSDTSSDTACADGALVLTRAITTALHHRFPARPRAEQPQRVLLTCAPGEHHALALDALAAALTELDVPATVLGPAPPTSAVLHAVEQTRPPLVLVWAQRAATAHSGVLQRLASITVTVAAGPGWSATRLPKKIRWVNTLDDAVALAREATPQALPPRTSAPDPHDGLKRVDRSAEHRRGGSAR